MPNVPTIDCLNGRVQKTKLQQVCQHSLSQPRGSPHRDVPEVCHSLERTKEAAQKHLFLDKHRCHSATEQIQTLANTVAKGFLGKGGVLSQRWNAQQDLRRVGNCGRLGSRSGSDGQNHYPRLPGGSRGVASMRKPEPTIRLVPSCLSFCNRIRRTQKRRGKWITCYCPGSSIIKMRSTARSWSVCLMPLGQRISKSLMR
jgi:hypothetical protein